MQIKKVTKFVKHICESFDKHFQYWYTDYTLFILTFFTKPQLATIFCNKVLGADLSQLHFENVNYHSDYYKATILLPDFVTFVDGIITPQIIMKVRQHPLYINSLNAITMIANGANIWNSDVTELIQFREIYLFQYSGLPTNTQFVEHGVKESGYVTLGRRKELNQSIMVMARGRIISEALLKGRVEINQNNEDDEDDKQLKGKTKTIFLMQSVCKYLNDLEEMIITNQFIDYNNK